MPDAQPSRKFEVSREIASNQRQLQALEFRKAGLTFEVIAQRVGYASASGAYKAVQRALRDLNEKAATQTEELRRLELERLDRLNAGLWARAVQGDPTSVDRALKISERRAKLLGLDAPKVEEHTVKVEKPPLSPEDAKAFLERKLGSHGTGA